MLQTMYDIVLTADAASRSKLNELDNAPEVDQRIEA
jgi:hypothetical protein